MVEKYESLKEKWVFSSFLSYCKVNQWYIILENQEKYIKILKLLLQPLEIFFKVIKQKETTT